MVRSKVKLNYIPNNSSRRASYKKRSTSLLKKTSELGTICDVQACSISYGPYSPTPEVWPLGEGAQEVLTRFRNMSEYQKNANKATLESFTKEQIRKQEVKLAKHQKKNFCNDMSRLMFKRMRGESTSKASLEDLLEMGSISDQKMREITERLEEIKLEENVNASQDGNGMGLTSGLTTDRNETIGIGQEGGFTADPNISSNLPSDPTNGCEGFTDELLALYHEFNWEEKSTLFPDILDGDSMRANENNP